jgi:hypothetical protein
MAGLPSTVCQHPGFCKDWQEFPHEDVNEPIRVLVQTRTHHLRGADYYEKLGFMLDMVCQLLWKRRFRPQIDRFHLYGPPFSEVNRRIYFLVDHGQTPDDASARVLWYRYNGGRDPLSVLFLLCSKRLIVFSERIPHPLPPKFQKVLQEHPFTRPRKMDPPTEPSDVEVRKNIRLFLHDKRPLRQKDVTFLNKHPDHAEWIKANSEPLFWAVAEAAMKSQQDSMLPDQDSSSKVSPQDPIQDPPQGPTQDPPQDPPLQGSPSQSPRRSPSPQ